MLILLSAACTSEDVRRDPAGFEADPPGQWWQGDVHVHATGASNDTGGDSFPEDIARIAQERGLHFVVLTDHSNSTGSDATTRDEDPALFNQGPEFPYWDRAAELSVPGKFLMLDGNEVSPVSVGETAPRGHIGCVPASLDAFDRQTPFVDRPRGEVTGGDVLRQAKALGCYTVLNHPISQFSWISYDWTDYGYEAMEVWNGGLGFDADDLKSWDAWRCDLLQGRSVTPIGASDNHRVFIEPPGEPANPPLGWPRTSVWAENLELPELIAGLRAGRVAIHEGQSFLQLDGYDAERRRTEVPAQMRWLRVRGKLDPAIELSLVKVLRATQCDDKRPMRAPEIVDEEIFVQGVTGGQSFDYSVEIDGAAGVYSATLLSDDLHYGALSRAFTVAP